ncbi:GAF domain-containing protein [Ohtaekwangia sp.]|uniref:GAF domain-containing protein n=1 Tax=Ohtaekwangia sp. TaxID=2066019 RepID=UPI002F928DD9
MLYKRFLKRQSPSPNLCEEVKYLKSKLDIATTCLEQISTGNFNFDFKHGIEGNNKGTSRFDKILISVSEELRRYAAKDEQSRWAAEGLSKFMNLLKGDTLSQKNFYDKVLSFLVHYLQANQGGLFILNSDDSSDRFLELRACYAYSRKRHLQKRVDIGQGILGQVFLEKETAVFTDIPPDYIHITSGLGEATPRYLLLVPLKYNDEVLGVLEIASFRELKTYQIHLVEKIMENLASVSVNMRNARMVDQLLQEAEVRANTLQESEENLKRNLEELRAMQEEMVRSQAELARQSNLMKFIIDNIPFPIFVKDEHSRYTLVNRSEARLLNLRDKDIVGKDDRHFITDPRELSLIKESDEKVLNSDEPLELPMQSFTTSDGEQHTFKTTKIPFINDVTGKKNILGVSIDVTEKRQLESSLYQERLVSSRYALLDLVGRQRMLSQKIGLYCLALGRGKRQYVFRLEEAITLHEHSLQVIEFGGVPLGLSTSHPISPAEDSLHPDISAIKEIWLEYKFAANQIIALSSVSPIPADIEQYLCFIEEHSETLQSANDSLMKACISVNEGERLEAF